MSTGLFSINEDPQPGEKKVKLTDGFDQYAASQGLNKESTQYVKTQIENYWNRYIDTGGKVEFAKKSILGSIERELGRAKSDLQKDSKVLPPAKSAQSVTTTNSNPPTIPGSTSMINANITGLASGGLKEMLKYRGGKDT